MKILAIDTSQQWLNLVLGDENRIINVFSEQMGNQHAEKFVGALDDLLERSNAGINDIGLIAVTTGPGTFTGLRVGISFAKGLAMALGIKCLPLNTLDTMAAQAGIAVGPVSPMIDAKKGQIYTALYNVQDGTTSLSSAYVAIAPAEWLVSLPQETIVFGSGAIAYRDLIKAKFSSITILEEKIPSPNPESLYAMALDQLKHAKPIPMEELTAFYVRGADAELRPKKTEPQSMP